MMGDGCRRFESVSPMAGLGFWVLVVRAEKTASTTEPSVWGSYAFQNLLGFIGLGEHMPPFSHEYLPLQAFFLHGVEGGHNTSPAMLWLKLLCRRLQELVSLQQMSFQPKPQILGLKNSSKTLYSMVFGPKSLNV